MVVGNCTCPEARRGSVTAEILHVLRNRAIDSEYLPVTLDEAFRKLPAHIRRRMEFHDSTTISTTRNHRGHFPIRWLTCRCGVTYTLLTAGSNRFASDRTLFRIITRSRAVHSRSYRHGRRGAHVNSRRQRVRDDRRNIPIATNAPMKYFPRQIIPLSRTGVSVLSVIVAVTVIIPHFSVPKTSEIHRFIE
jgi:hypothetical protein